MDQCTKEVRLQNWKNIISECQARPDSQTAKQWTNITFVSRLIMFGNGEMEGYGNDNLGAKS